MKYPIEIKQLHQPDNDEICAVLQTGLSKNFEKVSVSQVHCPDLTVLPWRLAAQGICGTPTLFDVGGVSHLIPIYQSNKTYNFDELAKAMRNSDSVFFLGAGAGPFHQIGINSEMMANLVVGKNENIQTCVSSVNKENGITLQQISLKEFGLLGNFLASEGQPGNVIKVSAQCRIGNPNFIQTMREALVDKYPEYTVGIGGVFMINKGKAKLHVMPPFSQTPLLSDADVNEWLNFYDVAAPLVCLSVFYNNDNMEMDLRIEHTHCFGDQDGGHYHYDVTPEQVQYEGYFIVAERLVRVDQPIKSHSFGRN